MADWVVSLVSTCAGAVVGFAGTWVLKRSDAIEAAKRAEADHERAIDREVKKELRDLERKRAAETETCFRSTMTVVSRCFSISTPEEFESARQELKEHLLANPMLFGRAIEGTFYQTWIRSRQGLEVQMLLKALALEGSDQRSLNQFFSDLVEFGTSISDEARLGTEMLDRRFIPGARGRDTNSTG